MADQLFRRTAFITDLHFGRGGNSAEHNQDTLDFLHWAVDRARTWGAETLIMGGDWHDNRISVGVSTIGFSLAGLDLVNESFKRSIFIPGNHDLLYRERRDVASIEFARYQPNIQILRNPCELDGVTFLPWLVGDEYKAVRNIKSRYVFGHLEMPGFLMNAMVEMPDNPHAVHAEQFDGVEAVFTGHFHMRQRQGRVIYTGNVMPFSFSDANDSERGLMLLEWGGDPIFEAWPDQPLYMTAKLSEIVERPHALLRPKMTVRAALDLPPDVIPSYEALQQIRDDLVSAHGLRKLEIGQPVREDEKQDFKGEIVFRSVDQMVIDGLMSIDSPSLDRNRLVEIYRSLAA